MGKSLHTQLPKYVSLTAQLMLWSKGRGTRVPLKDVCLTHLVDVMEHLVKLLDILLINLGNAGQLISLGDSTFDPYLRPQGMKDL